METFKDIGDSVNVPGSGGSIRRINAWDVAGQGPRIQCLGLARATSCGTRDISGMARKSLS